MKARWFRFFAFAVVSGALTFSIGAQIAGLDYGSERYSLSATFEDATNLKDGDPVRISGVPVGEVTGIELVKGRALVGFEIDVDVTFPVDSEVAVRSENIIGFRELVISPGAGAELATDGDTLDNISNAIDLGALVNELGPLLEAVDPAQVNELVTALNTALDGNRDTVRGLTTDLVQVLDTMASRSETIVGLIDDYGILVDEVARRDRQIQQLIDNIVLITETFNASEDVLIQTLEDLPGFAERLDALLLANADHLDSVLDDLNLVVGTVHDNLDVLDEALAVTPPALLGITVITGRGDFLNANFLCISNAPPPCPHPTTDSDTTGIPTLEDILDELLAPLGGGS